MKSLILVHPKSTELLGPSHYLDGKGTPLITNGYINSIALQCYSEYLTEIGIIGFIDDSIKEYIFDIIYASDSFTMADNELSGVFDLTSWTCEFIHALPTHLARIDLIKSRDQLFSVTRIDIIGHDTVCLTGLNR